MRLSFCEVALAVVITMVLGCGQSKIELSQANSNALSINFMVATDMIGRRWPFEEDLEKYHVSEGRWLFVVVRDDCEHCKEVFEQYFQLSNEFENWQKIILVAGSSVWSGYVGFPRMSGTPDFEYSWPNSNEPVISSPAVFVLENGIITEASDGERAEKALEALSERSAHL